MMQSNEVLFGNFASSRRFGTQPDGFFHNGIDFMAPNNTGVKSRSAGVVKVTGTNPPGQDFGNYIRIFHPALNISSWYAHLQSFGVKVGQNVTAGQLIGQSNNTGQSTGPHLHFSQSTGEGLAWINPDNTPASQSGGDTMATLIDQNYLNAIFADYLERSPDPGANTAYVGKPFIDVVDAIRNSQERKDLLAKRAGVLTALQNQVNDLNNQFQAVTSQLEAANTITGQLSSSNRALQVTIDQQGKQIADLQKKISSLTPGGLTEPTLSSVLEGVTFLVKKWLGIK